MHVIDVRRLVVRSCRLIPGGEGATFLARTPFAQRRVVRRNRFDPTVARTSSRCHEHNGTSCEIDCPPPVADPSAVREAGCIIGAEGDHGHARGPCEVRPRSEEFESRRTACWVPRLGFPSSHDRHGSASVCQALPALGQGARGESVDDRFAAEKIECVRLSVHCRFNERITDEKNSTLPISRVPRLELGQVVPRERIGCIGGRSLRRRVVCAAARARTHNGRDETSNRNQLGPRPSSCGSSCPRFPWRSHCDENIHVSSSTIERPTVMGRCVCPAR
jgi:hypothetical protein